MRANPDDLANAERILVSFTGVGRGLGGIGVQTLEFVGSASRQGAPVFITDRTRSWGNRIEMQRLADLLGPHLEGREVATIGNSMGGFLAVLATSVLPVRVAIAFAPQFSVHPRIMWRDRRWKALRAGIEEWRYPSLDGHFRPGTTYYLFFGDHRLERLHAVRFPAKPNVRRFVFPGEDHGVGAYMKAHGVLDEMIAACLDDRFSLEDFAGRVGERPYEVDAGRRSLARRLLARATLRLD